MQSLRRYAPIGLLIAVQLVLVAVAPSKAPERDRVALGGEFTGSLPPGAAPLPGVSGGPGGLPSAGPGGSGGPGVAPGASGPGVVAPGTTVGPGTGTSGGASRPPGGGGVATGNTQPGEVCLRGLLSQPPCVAKWAGGDNGGATATGVTRDSITVVMYRNKDNAAVNAILQRTGSYISPANEQAFLEAGSDWINKNYQLYGRKIRFIYVQGTCEIAPADDACFRSEAADIAIRHKPFALFWDNNSNQPAFFEELSRRGVVNWGGWHFTDEFSKRLRPYHYDFYTGGDYQATIAGEYWCNRLANKPARYAGGSLKTKTRKVAIVYADTPTTTPAAKRLKGIIDKCDKTGATLAPYSSNTATAASQATTNASKYKGMGITSTLWFSDPIAPVYGTKANTAQNYYPEHVLVGSGLLDYDSLAQNYDTDQWRHAFGLSDLGQPLFIRDSNAGAVWRMSGRSGNPHLATNLMWNYMYLLAMGLQRAGPTLTPLSYEYGVLTMPGYDSWAQRHDPRVLHILFQRGDYTALSDVREVYWDPNRRSPINGAQGGYVALNGGHRLKIGEIPIGPPPLPASFG